MDAGDLDLALFQGLGGFVFLGARGGVGFGGLFAELVAVDLVSNVSKSNSQRCERKKNREGAKG